MDKSGTCTPVLSLAVPVLTRERFAELTGLEPGVVRGMMDRGYMPTIKIGRHRLVNTVALALRCAKECVES